MIWINQLLDFFCYYLIKTKTNKEKKRKTEQKEMFYSCFLLSGFSTHFVVTLILLLCSALCFTVCLTVCSAPCVKSLLHALGTQLIRGEGEA